MPLFREFILILVGGSIGSVLGMGFGALVGMMSPEFIDLLTHPKSVNAPEWVGAAMGMISGLLLGAGAMFAGRLVGAIRIWAMNNRAKPARFDVPTCTSEFA